MEIKGSLYPRRVLYMEIRGQGAIPLTRTDENLTPQEIEQKAAELAYFLRVPIEIFWNEPKNECFLILNTMEGTWESSFNITE